MFKTCTNDIAFAAMLCKYASPLQIVMRQHYHSYGQKWRYVVVVWHVYLGVY